MAMNLEELERKTRGFANMATGLGLPGDRPPSLETIDNALFWIRFALGIELDVEISPGDVDSITVIPMKGNLCAQLIVSGRKIVSLEIQKGYGLDFDELLDEDYPDDTRAMQVLEDLAAGKLPCKEEAESGELELTQWRNTLESSTLTNISRARGGIKVMPYQKTENRYPSSTSIAFQKGISVYATISEYPTLQYAQVGNLLEYC